MRQAILIGAALFALSAGPALGASATGDFNNDGWSDLAIGVPFEDFGTGPDFADVGVVQLVYGGIQGVDSSDLISQAGGAEAGDEFGWSLAAGDFNDDGFDDLAVGVPNEDVTINSIPAPIEYTDMGEVDIFWGSMNGLDLGPKPVTSIFRDSPDYQSFDQFGWALAAADFGKGAASDLAVGSPYDDNANTATEDSGSVSIFYGQTGGIDLIPSAVFDESGPDMLGEPREGDHFGQALAAANFGKGHAADLAVGLPDADKGRTTRAGAVHVLYGSSAEGLTATGNQRWTQDSPGIADTRDRFDQFGASLAAADFGRGGPADLAVAAPCEALGSSISSDCHGAVNVIYGTPNGLSAAGDQFWSQKSPGVAGKPQVGDGFGLAMTAANFGKSKQADLAISSDESVNGHRSAGAVELLYGAAGGLTSTGSQLWSEASPGVGGNPGITDGFGRSLAAGNFGFEGHADLVVGVPGEHFHSAARAGAVEVIYSRAKGLVPTFADFLNQVRVDSGDDPEADDQFGWSLSPRSSSLGFSALP